MSATTKYMFGARVQILFQYDLYGNPQVTQLLDIQRLEPSYDLGWKGTFGSVKLIRVEMTQSGVARVPSVNVRDGIEPYAYPVSFYDKRDAKELVKNQWRANPRVDVAVRNLGDEGAREAMCLLGKAQEFTESPGNKLYEKRFEPIMGDEFIWGNLDIFSRLMLGLNSLGVYIIEGALQDYQHKSAFQFDAAMVRSLWGTSQMLRSLTESEIVGYSQIA